MKKIILTAVALMGLTATAQVKIGTDVQNLAAGANFQVEGDGSNQFVVMKATGNVGIGTKTPEELLHISKNVTDVFLKIESTSTGFDTVGIKFKENYGSGGYESSITSSYTGAGMVFTAPRDLLNSQGGFEFKSKAGVSQMVLRTNSGNVGIGTTTPAQKLHVAGSVQIVDGSEGVGKILVSDAVGKGTWTAGGLNAVTTTAPGALPGTTVQSFIAGNAEFDTNAAGMIMRSPDGVKWKVTIGNGGVMTIVRVQ